MGRSATVFGRPRRRKRTFGVLAAGYVMIAAVLFGSSAPPFGVAVHAQQSRTVSDGAYTDEQARRGQAVYTERCASCHGATLGGAQAPPLVGDDFMRAWGGPLSELANKIQNTMPANDPGKLTRQQTADIVAYVLQTGKFPAGRAELGADDAALKQIMIPAPAGSSRQPATGGAAPT